MPDEHGWNQDRAAGGYHPVAAGGDRRFAEWSPGSMKDAYASAPAVPALQPTLGQPIRVSLANIGRRNYRA
jgi:hypothetical protein